MVSSSPTDAELATRIRQQEVVADLGQRALETADLDQLLADAAVARTLETDACGAFEVRPGAGEAALRAGVGWPAGLVGEATVHIVHVTAERDDSEWLVSVADEGIGIDPADQERVFEVFQRLPTPDDHPGMGIGLALCRRIVERHGGDIWVESDPGEGTTFSFTLPTGTDDDE